MTLPELTTIVEKYLLLTDKRIIKILAAFVIAANLPIPSPWLIIVSAASNGKSTLLSALQGVHRVHKIDNLTPKTFFSGMKSKEGEKSNSLIDVMHPGDVLLLKDLSTLISKSDDDLGEIMAQLRIIYDGNVDVTYGNGKVIHWVGKLSLLCGGTASVYDHLPKMSDMGDRFLLYHFDSPNDKAGRLAQGIKSLDQNNLDELAAAKELKGAFQEFIEGIETPEILPPISPELILKIVTIAELSTRARTAINRNKYKKDVFESAAYLEAVPRFAKELMSMAIGLLAVNGDWQLTAEDEEILTKIALDTIPRYRREVLETLTTFSVVETRGVALEMKMDTSTIGNILSDLEHVGMIERTEANRRNKWHLKDEYRQMVSKFQHIEITDQVLLDETDQDEPEIMPPPTETEFMISADS